LVLGQRTNSLFAKGGGAIRNAGKQVRTRGGFALLVDERTADQRREAEGMEHLDYPHTSCALLLEDLIAE